MEDTVAAQPDIHQFIDNLQVVMSELPQIDCPLKHIWTPGMYIRQIFMPAGTAIISKTHNTTHPYIVSMGSVDVYNSEKDETVHIEAPYLGVTKPGTRRVLNVLQDCIWTTFHPISWVTGNEGDLDEDKQSELVYRIESEIIEKRMIETRKDGLR